MHPSPILLNAISLANSAEMSRSEGHKGDRYPDEPMKTSLFFFFGCWLTSTVHAETLFKSGTITIHTNEAILINSYSRNCGAKLGFQIDGTNLTTQMAWDLYLNPRFVIAGPHVLSFTNVPYFTFQRLQGSTVQSAVLLPGAPPTEIDVPPGKTIQFYALFGYLWQAELCERGTTNFLCDALDSQGYMHPAVSGPLTVRAYQEADDPYSTDGYEGAAIISYIVMDEVVQVPTEGFLQNPATTWEVVIEKSGSGTNWSPVAAFHTTAEPNAFYRLKIIK